MFRMFLICSCLKCVRTRPVASVTNDIPRAQKWWLMYWVVFVCFSLTHDFISVGFGWLPLWFHVRLVCIVWLQLPYFRGAEFIFMTTLNKWTSIGREAQREQQQQRQQQQQQGGQQAGTPTLPGSRRLRENVAVVAAAVVDPGTPSVPPLPEEDEEEEEARSGGVRRAKRRQRRPRGSGSGSHSGNSEGGGNSGNSGNGEGSGAGMRRRAAAGNASRTRRSILGGGTSDGTSGTSNDTSNEAKDE